MLQDGVRERRLENGLTVLVREDHSAPVVAVVTHVKAGYFDEPDHLVGISHVLEHMYFKGTARRGVGEIARETKAAGGYLNAGTIYDRTSYYTVLPSSALEHALDIQADALQRSALDPEELRRELLVIVQEAKRKLDNPHAVAVEKLFETMFDVHRIRRWRIGSEDMLRGFTRDDVYEFYRTHYHAANTILSIAGDVDAAAVFEQVEAHYGAMPAGPATQDAMPAEPERREFRYRELDGEIARTYSQWGWRTPGTLHEDTPPLEILAVILGQGRASRLYRQVRDAGHASSISAYNYTPTGIGVFGIDVQHEPADTLAAFERIAAVVERVRETGVTEEEVERARNLLEARLLRRLETVEGQANFFASWQALGDWRLADEFLTRVMATTPDQVHDVTRRYLEPESASLLIYRPRAASVFCASSAEAYDKLFGARALRLPAPEPSVRGAAGPVRRRTRLDPVRVEDDVRVYTLGEGSAHIVVKPRRTTPLVQLALVCRGGLLHEAVGTAGLTGLMARTAVRGTRTRSAAQLAEEVESLGASIAPAAGSDTFDWSISVPARHLDAGLELLLDVTLSPAFRADEAERERRIVLSDLERVRDDMYQYPLRLALSAAFDGHPYGFSLDRLEDSMRRLDVGALEGWHAARVLSGSPYVILVGDIADPDAAAAEVAAMLASRLGVAAPLDTTAPHWPEQATRRAERMDREQTAMVLAFPGPPRNHDDAYALQVMSAAVAGLGGRLFEELRSRRSLAYAVSAAPLARWLGGAFIAHIGTAPEREAEARTALLDELMRLTDELLPEDEIERARRYLIGRWQVRQQTHAHQLIDLAHALLIGRGFADLREHEQRIRAVDGGRIRDAAARWIQPDRLVESVCGPTAA